MNCLTASTHSLRPSGISASSGISGMQSGLSSPATLLAVPTVDPSFLAIFSFHHLVLALFLHLDHVELDFVDIKVGAFLDFHLFFVGELLVHLVFHVLDGVF